MGQHAEKSRNTHRSAKQAAEEHGRKHDRDRNDGGDGVLSGKIHQLHQVVVHLGHHTASAERLFSSNRHGAVRVVCRNRHARPLAGRAHTQPTRTSSRC